LDLQPNYNFTKNWQKSNPFELLPGGKVGLCLAGDNPSGYQDSIQGTGWSLALMAILQPFLLRCPGRIQSDKPATLQSLSTWLLHCSVSKNEGRRKCKRIRKC